MGASVSGPAHLDAGEPNQDAWTVRTIRGHCVAVVADGLGSRPMSQVGSKAACTAVIDALRLWLPEGGAGLHALAALVQVAWRVRIGAIPANDAASTCIFTCLGPSKRLVGSIGDGLALWRSPSAIDVLGPDPARANASCTDALGVSRGLSAWRFAQLPSDTHAVALCTDGIAEDLLPERYDLFLDWLRDDIAPLSPSTRRRRLRRALEEWPTPKHLDDKTLAYMEFT